MPLPRPCKRCGTRYEPWGKRQKLCKDCLMKSQMKHGTQGRYGEKEK